MELRCVTIGNEAYVHPSWMRVGRDLWGRVAPMKRNYFLYSLAALESNSASEMRYAEFCANLRNMMRQLGACSESGA